MSLASVIQSPVDLRDQRWLDDRIADVESGMDAVLDISRNWSAGSNVGRLHPGLSAAAYVKECVGALRLGKAEIAVLLTETDWSNRQIAAVAGVSYETVRRTATDTNVSVERPAETLGADGKYRPARLPRTDEEILRGWDEPQQEGPIDDQLWRELVGVLDAIESLSTSDATQIAATVPQRRRAATAKRLRRLGTVLGRIAWTLEGTEETT